MKLSLSKKTGTRGSAMLIVLVTGTLMLLSLAGYLTLVNHQNYISVRSQAWNTSIATVEAGIEEAMEHLNANTNRMATDGWGYDGNRYVMDQDMGDGTGFSVSIDMTDPERPEIISQAFSTLDGSPIVPIFGAVGVVSQNVTLTRAVKVHAYRGGLFIKGMVARDKIDMKGNNILTDSFDSDDPDKSTGGQYDALKAGSKGDVYVNSSIDNALSAGNANIYGHVATGPRGTVAVGPGGGVGEKSWVSAHPGQIQPGYYADNMNFTFPETPLPYTTGLTPRPEWVVTTSNYVTETPHSGEALPGMEGVVTNVNYDYSTTYPGDLSGVVTNLVWQNTLTPPPQDQVVGAITTNEIRMNSEEWPGSTVGPVTTNVYWQKSATYPADVTGVRTNYTTKTSTSFPSPTPSGVITTNTAYAKSKSYPAEGTYVGTPVKLWGWWRYDLIIGYSWKVPEYIWPIREYVWLETHYVYQITTYGLPTYTYSWNNFTTNTVYFTNYYDLYLNSGDYVVSTLSGKVYVAGDANLVVLNDIRMSGGDVIRIGPNGKLHMYVDGTSSAISGLGIINETGLAENCIIEFTSRVREVTFNGNGEFVGVMVAPYSNLFLNGAGSGVVDFSGAVIANTVTLGGHFKFHYDEALGRLPRNGRYLVKSWDEVNPNNPFSLVTATATVP